VPIDVTVILVAYNSGKHLAESLPALNCVDSDISREVIVVNNFPEEDLYQLCIENHAKLYTPGSNLGFGRGVNFGYKKSSGDVILICNPDAIPEEGAITAALKYLDEHPDTGIVCPRLVYPDRKRQASVRRFYDWGSALYARVPWRNDGNPPLYFRRYMMMDDDRSQTMEIDWAIGAAMFIRCELIEKMGKRIFDPRYFLYFEDVDLCFTCWRTGYKVIYLPKAVFVHHYDRKSRKSPLSKANWYHLVSFLKFVFKHGGLPRRPSSQ
jgi:N-acetylglucosaminyl-diphospho-decaprenol L-rhamnosyltransferase